MQPNNTNKEIILMFETNPNVIDSQELFGRVVNSLAKKGLSVDYAGNVDNGSCLEQLEKLKNILQFSTQYRHILDTPVVSRPGIAGRIKLIIKRVVRKATYWFWKPFWDQQNAYNESVYKLLEGIIKMQEILILQPDSVTEKRSMSNEN
jgi:hypothetical protein